MRISDWSSDVCSSDLTIADFFESTLSFSLAPAPFVTYVTNTPFENLDVVAADPRLEELSIKLEAKQKIYKLRDALRKLKGYDALFIDTPRSEEHTSELQSLMRISYAVFCLKKKNKNHYTVQ